MVQDIENTMLLVDKGYHSNALVEERRIIAVIPSKKNRKQQRDYHEHVYKKRHLIECFFGKIKHFRRVFSRFDKTATVFTSFLQFVGVLTKQRILRWWRTRTDDLNVWSRKLRC